MTAGYSNNSHVNYVVNDNGSYRLLNTPNFPAPTSTAPTSYVYKSSGSINVPTTFRPLSCNAGNTGANWFGNHINFAKGGTNDNDTSNNCKSLPVWNNALWLWYLIGEEWNGCVESRPYNKNLDISLEMNLSNPDHKFVPMAPALRSHKNDSTNYAYNEYGAIGSTTAITHYVADLYNNQDLFHRNLGTYYFYHAISKTNATRSIFCQPLLPLQTNFDVIKNYMNNVQLSITTNSPEGLYWGWHLVSPNKPFDAAGPYNDSYKKIIIVITDGLPNLIKNSYGSSFENQFDPIDDDPATTSNKTQNIIDRYKALCTNIKNYEVTNGGVEIYAIGVGEENDLEKECVTDVDHYSSIDVTQLTQKLKNIAKQIGKVSIVE
jgi:hypothetical protein